MAYYEDINNYVQAVLNAPDMTDAGKAAAINAAAEQYGVSREDIATATGYDVATVNSYLGGGNDGIPASAQTAVSANSGIPAPSGPPRDYVTNVGQAAVATARAATPAYMGVEETPIQAAVNQWKADNPNATPKQVADAITAAGGLTPEIAQAVATAYNTTSNEVTSVYNQLASNGGSLSPASSAASTSLTPAQAAELISRSQITGVPTSEFNRYGGYDAVYALAAQSGQDLGRPSDAAVVQYGPQAAANGYGNMSYTPGASTGYYSSAVTNAVNQWKTDNPNATPQQLADAIKAAGGLTTEIAQAVATAYGTTVDEITAGYNRLTGTGAQSAGTQGTGSQGTGTQGAGTQNTATTSNEYLNASGYKNASTKLGSSIASYVSRIQGAYNKDQRGDATAGQDYNTLYGELTGKGLSDAEIASLMSGAINQGVNVQDVNNFGTKWTINGLNSQLTNQNKTIQDLNTSVGDLTNLINNMRNSQTSSSGSTGQVTTTNASTSTNNTNTDERAGQQFGNYLYVGNYNGGQPAAGISYLTNGGSSTTANGSVDGWGLSGVGMSNYGSKTRRAADGSQRDIYFTPKKYNKSNNMQGAGWGASYMPF